MKSGNGASHFVHCRAEIGPFKTACDYNESLQILAANFILRWKLLDRSERTKCCCVPRAAVEHSALYGIERIAMFFAEAHPDGVGTAIGNKRIARRQSIENGGRVL